MSIQPAFKRGKRLGLARLWTEWFRGRWRPHSAAWQAKSLPHLILLLVLLCNSAARAGDTLQDRWVYLQLNLQVPENVSRAAQILRQAKASGYNGVVLADYKLNILGRVPDFYFEHARAFRKLAEESGLEIIPAVAPVGYSDGILAHDPNLAEGLPVKNARFVVRGGLAELSSDLRNPLPGGTFEAHRNHTVAGWDFQDAPGQSSFVDTRIKHGGESSLRWDDPGNRAPESHGNARVSRKVRVTPWHAYHASVWIKTQDYEAARDVRLFALANDGRTLSYSNLGVRRDQDWTQHHVVFNSLDNSEIGLYCGTWGGRGGTLWMDDLQLEETAFVNLLRRDGCPLVVSDDQGTTYDEGVDFEPLADPKMGHVPYAGSYDVWHTPPRLKVTAHSRIREGQELHVTFWHTVTIYDNQVTCCLAHPKVFEILADQVRRVDQLFAPHTYFLSHDEIRLANWCDACRQEGRTAGQLLAENVRQCVQVIHRVNPQARLCIWSDMFDPHHNAHDRFYLVNGDLAGSWLGLPKTMTVVNWNSGAADQSLAFFERQGHDQVLAGYYDHDPKEITAWLSHGAGVHGIRGVMYTTWQNNFRELDAFAKAAWGSPN